MDSSSFHHHMQIGEMYFQSNKREQRRTTNDIVESLPLWGLIRLSGPNDVSKRGQGEEGTRATSGIFGLPSILRDSTKLLRIQLSSMPSIIP